MDTDALTSAIFGLVAFAVYAFLGWRLSRRRVSQAAQLPAAQFGLFWLGLAAITLFGALESFVAGFQPPPLAIVITLVYLEILVLCVVLWGLVGYLIYLFTGRTYTLSLLGLYGFLYVLLLYFITASQPDAVTVSSGVVGLHYTSQVGGPFLVVLFAIAILPEFIGSLLYFSLFFRTKDPTVRFRVTLVSWSLIAWFGLSSANIGAALGGSLAAQIVGRSLGVIAGLVILLAYYPPRSWQARFGIRRIDDASLALT